MKTVNEIMMDRCDAAGLDPDLLDEPGQRMVAALTPGLGAALAGLEADPFALRVVAEVLRSYADVAEGYADAVLFR